MSEMVERMARAMWEARREHIRTLPGPGLDIEEWGDGSIPRANGIIGEAMAAIKAMREPTDEMFMALGSEAGNAAVANWQTMIDAALAEPKS